MSGDRWIYAWAGRDMMRERGYIAVLLLLPRPSLMRRGEEGMYVLAALRVIIRTQRIADGQRLRLPFWIDIRSDAGEIATRRAMLARSKP